MENCREELYEKKVPLLRISGRDAKRARMACRMQADCGEFGRWEVAAGWESDALKRSMQKAGYSYSVVGNNHVWCNSDEVHAACDVTVLPVRCPARVQPKAHAAPRRAGKGRARPEIARQPGARHRQHTTPPQPE